MTDNPMSSAHQNESGQESDCGIARRAECCTTVASDGPDLRRSRRVHENPGWDAKEIGGLCVTVWLVFYLLAHRFFKSSARGVLTISMLGNIVVSLAWFGPQLNGLHQYGTFSQSILLMAVAANLVFFAIGYCPAGWLRSKQA